MLTRGAIASTNAVYTAVVASRSRAWREPSNAKLAPVSTAANSSPAVTTKPTVLPVPVTANSTPVSARAATATPGTAHRGSFWPRSVAAIGRVGVVVATAQPFS
jgi:hypothetical protein